MTLCSFVLLSAINTGLLLFLIRKRGWVSSEGLCAMYLLAMVVTDNLEVFVRAYWWPETLPLGPDEINLRIYPTMVHIAGIVALLVGLHVADPRPRSISRLLGRNELRTLARIGGCLVVIGAIMYGTVLYLVGATTLGAHALDTIWNGERSVAGFWYRGIDIMLVGALLLFVSLRGYWRAIAAAAAVAFPVLMTHNKGGLEKSLLWAAFVCYAYQKRQFRAFFRAATTWMIWVPVAVLLVILTVGAKNYYLANGGSVNATESLMSGLDSVRARYSADGLYRGYSQMVTYMRNGSAEYFQGRLLSYTLTGWVPGFIYQNKPNHPTHDTGYMIYSDHHSYASDASAFTLVGLAYSDFGVVSVVSYLLVGGLVLGRMRRAAIRSGGSLYYHVGYVFVCLFGACNSESGFMDFIYVCVFAAVAMGLTWIALGLFSPAIRRGRLITRGTLQEVGAHRY
jgi:hypothetical protein